jgi:hypothetical protein
VLTRIWQAVPAGAEILNGTVIIQKHSQVSGVLVSAGRFDNDSIPVEQYFPVELRVGRGGFHCRNLGQDLG